MEPHSCSRIISHAFYLLANSPGWSLEKAGQIFLKSAFMFWSQETNIHDSGCAMIKTVEEMNFNKGGIDSIIESWRRVGIDLSTCIRQKNGVQFENGRSRNGKSPEQITMAEIGCNYAVKHLTDDTVNGEYYFQVKPNTSARNLWVIIHRQSTESQMMPSIYVARGKFVSEEIFDNKVLPVFNTIDFMTPIENSSVMTIMLKASMPYNDLTLAICNYS